MRLLYFYFSFSLSLSFSRWLIWLKRRGGEWLQPYNCSLYFFKYTCLPILPIVSITNDYVNRQSWVVIEKNRAMKDSFVLIQVQEQIGWMISKRFANGSGRKRGEASIGRRVRVSIDHWLEEEWGEGERKREEKEESDVFEKITILSKETQPYQNIAMWQNRFVTMKSKRRRTTTSERASRREIDEEKNRSYWFPVSL